MEWQEEQAHTKPSPPTTKEPHAQPPPLGPCQLLVHAIEARDLAPRDSDGNSDPIGTPWHLLLQTFRHLLTAASVTSAL